MNLDAAPVNINIPPSYGQGADSETRKVFEHPISQDKHQDQNGNLYVIFLPLVTSSEIDEGAFAALEASINQEVVIGPGGIFLPGTDSNKESQESSGPQIGPIPIDVLEPEINFTPRVESPQTFEVVTTIEDETAVIIDEWGTTEVGLKFISNNVDNFLRVEPADALGYALDTAGICRALINQAQIMDDDTSACLKLIESEGNGINLVEINEPNVGIYYVLNVGIINYRIGDRAAVIALISEHLTPLSPSDENGPAPEPFVEARRESNVSRIKSRLKLLIGTFNNFESVKKIYSSGWLKPVTIGSWTLWFGSLIHEGVRRIRLKNKQNKISRSENEPEIAPPYGNPYAN